MMCRSWGRSSLVAFIVVLGLVPATSLAGVLTFDGDMPDPPERTGGLRRLHVRPTTPAEQEHGYKWKFFGYGEIAPDSPDQDDIVLTADDALTLVVPELSHFPTHGPFGVAYSREGSQLTLNAYFVLTCQTATMYGAHEYLEHIGQLPAGDYELTIRFLWGLGFWRDDWTCLDGFLSDPDAFNEQYGVQVVSGDSGDVLVWSGDDLVEIQYSLAFTVQPSASSASPEPASMAVLALGGLALRRRR